MDDFNKKVSEHHAKITEKGYLPPENPTKIHNFEDYVPEWVNLVDIKAKNQPWFWLNIIPFETLTLFAGYGGIGKSLLLLYIIAKTTTGHEFSAGGMTHKLPQGSVILLSAEDDIETQIKPKLLAFGADLTKIHFIKFKKGSMSKKKKFLELDKDMEILIEKVKTEKDVQLIIYDPITYFIGNIRDHINSEVANFLQMQIDIAKEYSLGIILNMHLRKSSTKGKGGGNAQDEVAGSKAWINSPRKCWLISDFPDDKDVKAISNLKDNLGKKSEECLAYKIETTTITDGENTIETVKLVWLDKKVILNSNDAVANKEEYAKSKQTQCVEFIYNYIKQNGQSRGDAIKEAASNCGFKETTFKVALSEFKSIYKGTFIEAVGIKNQKTYRFVES